MNLQNCRIAILHSATRREFKDTKLINLLRIHWSNWGAEVIDIYGTDSFIPADLVLVHVDLSIVPKQYHEFALRYPVHINADVLDIRKSSICDHLLSENDDYDGPVIVKTDLNFAGIPERNEKRLNRNKFQRFPPIDLFFLKLEGLKRRLSRYPEITTKDLYQIFESLQDVPKKYFDDKTVVQKYLPEKSGDNFILREYYFLGDREYLNVEKSEDPSFTTGEQIEFIPGVPPAEIRAIRKKLNLRYGKIDYAIHEGETVIFDVNKTVGTVSDESIGAGQIADYLAPGIINFLPEKTHSP